MTTLGAACSTRPATTAPAAAATCTEHYQSRALLASPGGSSASHRSLAAPLRHSAMPRLGHQVLRPLPLPSHHPLAGVAAPSLTPQPIYNETALAPPRGTPRLTSGIPPIATSLGRGRPLATGSGTSRRTLRLPPPPHAFLPSYLPE